MVNCSHSLRISPIFLQRKVFEPIRWVSAMLNWMSGEGAVTGQYMRSVSDVFGWTRA